jgi:demethylmenaquinone methyltransferase/2-methoxy-6-polyprenyl-1,4-benzoquinol methylase
MKIKMSTYLLMKILESVPQRYDKGIRILIGNKLDNSYNQLASYIKRGQKVLDIGCGTGALTLRAARKGAFVKGIDINPQMLEIAQKKAEKGNFGYNIELCEMGIAELGEEKSESFDVVMSGLCFSELSENELNFALQEIRRILKPGGLLLAVDEVKAKNPIKKIINWMIRFPLLIITYFLTQTITHPVKNLPERLKHNGFEIISIRLNRMENFIELIAKKPKRRLNETN